MTLVAVTMVPFQRVANSRSITSMRTRRETGKVMSGMPAMMAAVSTALDLKGEAMAGATVEAVTART
jgi:hypothetical protein